MTTDSADKRYDGIVDNHGPARPWMEAHWTVVVIAMVAVVAFLLYAPFQSRPFDIRDFSEFVPLLQANESMTDRFRSLVDYYATRGRFNPVAYLVLAAKWGWFGWNSVAWQVLRFVQMTALVLSVLVFLRRIGSTPIASAIGGALFVVGGAATHGWVRLTMGEALGSQIVMLALLYGLAYQRTPNWGRAAAVFGCLIAVLLLVKEMFVAAVPLMVMFALCWQPDGRLRMPRLSRRNVVLVCAALVASTLALAPVAYVAATSSPGAYTHSFGKSGIPVFRLVVWLAGAVTPYLVMSWRTPVWALLQLGLFLFLLWVGWTAANKGEAPRRHNVTLAVVFGLHVVAAVVLYLPWPVYQPFYAMPVLISQAVVVAAGVSASQAAMPSAFRYLLLGWAGVLCAAGIQALDYRRAADAEQRFHAEMVSALSRLEVDTVVVANKKAPAGDRAWQGFGATLARYGGALSLRMPAILDRDCEQVQSQYPELLPAAARNRIGPPPVMPRAVVIRFGNTCAGLGTGTNQLVRRYPQFNWNVLRPALDSFYVHLYSPRDPMGHKN